MNREYALELLKRYVARTCTPEEEKLLMQWLNERASSPHHVWENEAERAAVQQALAHRLNSKLFAPPWYRRKTVLRPVAAACLLVLCGTLIWTYLYQQPATPYHEQYTGEAVTPGSNAAVLTLADGATIRLDEAHNGLLSNKNGVAIKKMDNGNLVYEVDDTTLLDKDGNIAQNTISIPRGGKYQLTLPDGSKVWLNSGSSLTYPAAFVANTRTVSLIGEAYFEVVPNKKQPFIVTALDNQIEVTGTHFNVSAYRDQQQIKTTLIEGGVIVSKNNTRLTLHPGQQAISKFEQEAIEKRNVDPFYATAWTKGYFVFEDQDIQAIMSDIARWYNVTVEYRSATGKTAGSYKKIGGTYLRSKGLKELLNHLETLSNVRFQQTEGRVIVHM